MLDFYLIDPNLELAYYDTKGTHIGSLTLEDVQLLHQVEVVIRASNEFEATSIPFFDDFQLSLDTITQMYKRYIKYKEITEKLDFQFVALEKYGQILESAIKMQQGLQAICD